MSKPVKLILSIFLGLDIFVAGWLGLANLRFILFGEGAIPGGGSALDMALFLLPAFLGYLAGDRLYYFLTYKERREKKRQQALAQSQTVQAQAASAWEEGEWDDNEKAGLSTSQKQEH